MATDTKTVTITVRLDEPLAAKLKRLAKRGRLTTSGMIRLLISRAQG